LPIFFSWRSVDVAAVVRNVVVPAAAPIDRVVAVRRDVAHMIEATRVMSHWKASETSWFSISCAVVESVRSIWWAAMQLAFEATSIRLSTVAHRAQILIEHGRRRRV